MKSRLLKYVTAALASFVLLSLASVLAMRWVNPVTSTFMIAKGIDDVVEGNSIDVTYEWSDMANISRHLQLAVIAAEDQKFPTHWGFDLDSMANALESNAQGKRIRGASTISQQVAKNLFLWSGRSYFRKGLEAYFTLLIELFWSKQRTLEIYLNVAEFGVGIYGAEAAARQYFNKNASQLSRAESSLLAAVLPNPKRYNAARPDRHVAARSRWIRHQMNNLGLDHLPK